MPLVNILNPTSISPSSIYTTLVSGIPASPVLTVPTGNFYNIKYAFTSVLNGNNTGGSLVLSLDASGHRLLTSTSISNAAATAFIGISGNFYLMEGQSLYIRSRPDTSAIVYPTGAYVMFDIYT